MVQIDWLFFLLVLGIAQGLFLVVALRRIEQRNTAANRFLSVFILLIALTMIGRMVANSTWVERIPNLLAFPDAIIYLYGPFLYFYFHKLFHQAPVRRPWIHFLPGAIYLTWEVLMALDQYVAGVTLPFVYVNHWGALVEGTALLQNTVYWALFVSMFRRYIRRSDNQFAYSQYPAYLKTILVLIGIILVLWSYAYATWAFWTPHPLTWVSYRGVWLTLSFISYVLAYFAILQPDLFKLPPEPVPPVAQGMEEVELRQLKATVHQIMCVRQSYLAPKLKLAELAEQVQVSPHVLSRVINEGYGQNFSDFVNQYRVEAFIDLAQQDGREHYTLLALAYEAGFNSKTTFHTAFKKVTGMTPGAYLKKQPPNGVAASSGL